MIICHLMLLPWTSYSRFSCFAACCCDGIT